MHLLARTSLEAGWIDPAVALADNCQDVCGDGEIISDWAAAPIGMCKTQGCMQA